MDNTKLKTAKTTPIFATETANIPAPVSTPAYTPAMPFGKANYQLMIAGIVTVLIGFFVMTLDTEPFGFGFLGLTLGPILVTAGFIIEFFAILKKPGAADKVS